GKRLLPRLPTGGIRMSPSNGTRRVLLIGNRSGAAREIGNFPELRLVHVLALAESRLEREWKSLNCGARFCTFTAADQTSVLDELSGASFDLLVSHGCPFVLPVAMLRRPHQLFINLHPSALPRMR